MVEADVAGTPGMEPSPSRAARRARKVFTADQRAALGKAARAKVPRSSQATVEAGAGRPDPIELLESQAATRIPELVPIRYGRMVASPFAFYRGAALIMASDLARSPNSGLRSQLCGDAHLSNFGIFASPERRLVFDANDFDETLHGPFEWDVKRLAASLAVAGRENEFSDADRKKIVLSMAAEYRKAMTAFAGMRTLELWYARIDVDELMPRLQQQTDPKRLKQLEKSLVKARSRDSLQAYAKLARDVDGEPRIISDPPLIVPIEELLPEPDKIQLEDALSGLVRSYRRSLMSDRRHLLEQYRVVDLARKVVGVGSVGTRAWIVLLLGKDGNDPLFLQAKEAQASVLEAFTGKAEYANQGERVVAGQRLMQAVSDIFLGWDRVAGLDGITRDFYVRQLRDGKASVDPSAMIPRGMAQYAMVCGWTLARAHARSGDRIAIASYLGSGDRFDRAIASFAEAYADQNERDHALLARAIKDGRVQVEQEPGG